MISSLYGHGAFVPISLALSIMSFLCFLFVSVTFNDLILFGCLFPNRKAECISTTWTPMDAQIASNVALSSLILSSLSSHPDSDRLNTIKFMALYFRLSISRTSALTSNLSLSWIISVISSSTSVFISLIPSWILLFIVPSRLSIFLPGWRVLYHFSCLG